MIDLVLVGNGTGSFLSALRNDCGLNGTGSEGIVNFSVITCCLCGLRAWLFNGLTNQSRAGESHQAKRDRFGEVVNFSVITCCLCGLWARLFNGLTNQSRGLHLRDRLQKHYGSDWRREEVPHPGCIAGYCRGRCVFS